MKKYFTMSQAAKVCAVSRGTMHRWVSAGKIQSYTTPGGHKRILPDVLNRWLEDNHFPFDISAFENKKNKILIVDDDKSVRRYLDKLLKGPFIETETAPDGFEAGKKIFQFKPDLIFLDISMPNMDGFEVCRNIKNDPNTKHIKIVILTGHGTKNNEENAMNIGADAFLRKPSSKNEILQCIENLLIPK
jgi:excisionase family DNA binding protein